MPLVSFCIPTYGRARYLRGTIGSALAQSLPDIEVVVVDDVSPDETAEVVRRIRDPRVRYVRNDQNLGVPDNLNRAFSLARGEFAVLLEDHDLLSPDYAERTIRLLRKHPGMVFVATGQVQIDEDGAPLACYLENIDEVTSGRAFLRKLLTRVTCPFSVTTTVRRSCLKKLVHPFDPQYGWYADQNLWMQLCTIGDVGYLRAPLLQMRVREADHFLSGKPEWEILLLVDRIHRENWRLLHPSTSARDLLDRATYDVCKTARLAMTWAARLGQGKPWAKDDWAYASKYVSPVGRALFRVATLCPTTLIPSLRRLYRWQFRLRRSPSRLAQTGQQWQLPRSLRTR